MKRFNEFINEELSPYKYKKAANALDKTLHKTRKDSILNYYKEKAMDFAPLDIEMKKNNDYVLYKNCTIVDIDTEFSENDTMDITFKSEKGNLIKWTYMDYTEDDDDVYVTIAYKHNEMGFYLTNRRDAKRFINHIKSIINKDDVVFNDFKKANVNDFFISNTDIEFIDEDDYVEEIDIENNQNDIERYEAEEQPIEEEPKKRSWRPFSKFMTQYKNG